MAVSKKESSPCPIDAALTVIDGRWKGTILWCLLEGPKRPIELEKSIPQITERMLIRHLKELTEDGIVSRTDHGQRGVSYAISEYGLTLLPVLEQLCAWGRIHQARMARPYRPIPV